MTPANPVDYSVAAKWSGFWRWEHATAKFTNPHHADAWHEQYQHIRCSDGFLWMRCFQHLKDGRFRSWTYDGALDGKPRPIVWDDDGTPMATIAFLMLSDNIGGDINCTPDGRFRGAEHFLLEPDRCSVWGSGSAGGETYPYFEEWHRTQLGALPQWAR